MIVITDEFGLDEGLIEVTFLRSGGPGGQNVNKVATGVQLRLAIAALPEAWRPRLARLAGQRLTAAGELVITATDFRTQEQNRAAALARLTALLRAAAAPPKPRRATRPSRAARAERLEAKRRRSGIKQLRRSPPEE